MGYKLAVLVSGDGSNLQALIDRVHKPQLATISLVASDNPAAGALKRARQADIPALALPPEPGEGRLAYHRRLSHQISQYTIDLTVLAGYMRLLPREFLRRYQPMLNVHPSLLPAFPGLDAPAQAIEYGVKLSGCTIHLVDAGMDTGPVVLQQALALRRGETAAELHRRIKSLEHSLLVRAVTAFARGQVEMQGREIWIKGEESET